MLGEMKSIQTLRFKMRMQHAFFFWCDEIASWYASRSGFSLSQSSRPASTVSNHRTSERTASSGDMSEFAAVERDSDEGNETGFGVYLCTRISLIDDSEFQFPNIITGI